MNMHKIKLYFWLAAICAVLVFLFGGCNRERIETASAPVTRPAPDKHEMLFTFENPAEINAWTFNHSGNLVKDQSAEWANSGRNSMKVTYDPGINWPTISLVRPKIDAAGVDPKLARFYQLLDGGIVDTIAVTMRNPNGRDINLLVNAIPFRLPAQSVTPVEFSIRQLADGCKGETTLIPSFAIWGFPEQGAFSIYMDDIALYKQPDNRAYAAQVEQDQARAVGADCFVLGVESAMRQVYPEPHRYTPFFASSVALKAARNESECFQAVVVPVGGALKDLTWTLPPLVDKSGQSLPASVRVVGYVHCDPVRYALNADGGWYPDLLVDVSRVAELAADTHLSLWVKVHAPADAKPGEYMARSPCALRAPSPRPSRSA